MASQDYGHRPLAPLVDQIARDEPDRVWASIPKSDDDLRQGWQDITFKQFANAVNRVARLIVRDLGKSTTFDTLTYIGPNDLRYLILVLASIKTGYRVLFVSPRNALEGNLSLFEKTNCNILYYARSMQTVVAPWLQHRDMKALLVGEQAEWLDATEVPPYPYNKTWNECRFDTFAVLHTSGSTGIPKPIDVKQGSAGLFDGFQNAPLLNGRQHIMHAFAASSRFFCPMPFFHAAGLFVSTCMTYYQSPIVLGPASRPLSIDIIEQVIDYANVDAGMLPPSLLDDMSRNAESTARLAKLKFVAFGGGALTTTAGDALAAANVTLMNVIASTETSILAQYVQDAADWDWFIFDDELSGLRWDKVSGSDDVYEQVVVRRSGDVDQGAFYTFPHLSEWSTKDLFVKHPTRPNQWRFAGRADNIIVFSNGEKLNPTTIEDHVMGHPKVRGAVVVGAGKFQPALLIEPTTFPATEEEKRMLIEDIWPIVLTANKETVAHGRIGKQFIGLTREDKPFPRAGKGSIQRGLANQQYQEEVDKLYEDAGHALEAGASKLDVSSEKALLESLGEAFKDQLSIDALEPDADFFASGIDSVQVLIMSRTLRAGLEAASGHAVDADTIATRVIYTNPTLRRLATSLYSNVVSGKKSDSTEWLIRDMEVMVEKYIRNLPAAKSASVQPAATDLTVVLTGSTGSLGSYILADLVANSAVSRVVCLNRAEDGRARQTKVSSERGLATDFAKVDFLQADLAKDQLGLSGADYTKLLQRADRVIHNQWQVNFNLSLASFEPFVRGTYNLVKLAAAADKQPHITFVSSIGTVDSWGASHSGQILPEVPLSELNLPHAGFGLATGGYGQSKQVASVILERAAETSGVRSAIVRVGQIAGPLQKQGQWNRQEWLPTILASSAYLGALPSTLGMMDAIDWTPTEALSGFLLDLAGVNINKKPAPQGYYHAVNPHMTSWPALLPAIQAYFGERITRMVSLSEWVELLAQSEAKTDDVGKNPGVKLLDFYKGLDAGSKAGVSYMQLATERSVEASPTLRELQAVQGPWMANWLQQWSF